MSVHAITARNSEKQRTLFAVFPHAAQCELKDFRGEEDIDG
jgi:hypothetical protein